jgi:hypothetical protein
MSRINIGDHPRLQRLIERYERVLQEEEGTKIKKEGEEKED